MKRHHWLLALAVMSGTARAQESAPLPGKGLRQHPFLYCGEWQDRGGSERVMKLVRDGRAGRRRPAAVSAPPPRAVLTARRPYGCRQPPGAIAITPE